jgi:hypothetical protein
VADDKTDPGVIDKASETVVLGVELVGAELDKLPERLEKAVTSADFQAAIKKALEDFAAQKLKTTTTTLTAAEAQALGKATLDAGTGAVEKSVLDGIKNSEHYQALDKSLKELTETFKKTPMGLWLDKNKTWLYIIGAGGVLAGAATMYVLRTGDDVTKLVMPLVKDISGSFTVLGQLKLGGGLDSASFTPSARRIEAKTFVTAEWKGIKVKINVSVTAADKKVTATTDGQVLIPVTKDTTATVGGAYNSGNKNWSLSVGVKTKVGGGLELGIFAGIGKGGVGALPAGDPFKALPEPPKDDNRTGGFVGLGISGHF